MGIKTTQRCHMISAILETSGGKLGKSKIMRAAESQSANNKPLYFSGSPNAHVVSSVTHKHVLLNM